MRCSSIWPYSAYRFDGSELGVVLSLLVLTACASSPPGTSLETGALSPDEALQTFQFGPRLEIEVFAAEPFVRDPVDLVFDEYGRAYVAEMLDYPYDPEPGTRPLSRIRRLIDSDGDGRIDEAVVFADSIAQLTGLQPWRGGLIATAAPDILYLPDRDGDGRADTHEVLFTGFAMANPQHRIAGPRFALDNWIYVANDGQQGALRPVSFPVPRAADDLSVLGADFRFRMDAGIFEAASGPAQFGQTFDEAGRRFIMHNTTHVRHVVLPRRYLQRNPLLPPLTTARDISDHGLRLFQTAPPQDWRVARSEIRGRRYEQEGTGWTEHVEGHFTGVAGGLIYDATALPDEYAGDLFTGEVAANLVHRDVLRQDGVSFVASRGAAETASEFLTSTDPWFRPVNVTVGPDGALYIVDMYREFIESPEYIPVDIRESIDFYSGTMQGRIYRVQATGRTAKPIERWPGDSDVGELVAMLEDRSSWWRMTAHRLLVERADSSAAPLLRGVASSGSTAAARVHALHVLESFGALSADVLGGALRDSAATVIEHALALAEGNGQLEIERLIEHPDARVRFQAALTAGSLPAGDAVDVLVRFAASGIDDSWSRAAVLTAPPQLHAELLERLVGERERSMNESGDEILTQLASVVGARGLAGEVRNVVELVNADPTRPYSASVLRGLSEGLALAGIQRLVIPGSDSMVAALERTRLDRQTIQALARRFYLPDRAAAATEVALDTARAVDERIGAVLALSSGSFDQARPALMHILATDGRLHRAALEVLATYSDRDVADAVVSQWPEFSLDIRSDAGRILAGRRTWAERLIEAVSTGAVAVASIEPGVRLSLLEHPDASLWRSAVAVFESGRSPAPNRDMVLSLRGDAEAGRGIFYTHCASCHVPGPLVVGPNLIGVSNKTADQLLEAIVAPDDAVPGSYAAYVAELDDGTIRYGRIASESPGILTLRNSAGDYDLLRHRVAAIRQADRSLMPESASEHLSSQELADLIAYLQAQE